MKTEVKRAVMWVVAFLALAVVAGAQEPEQEAEERAFLVATDFPSIQDAIDALPWGGGTVYIPAGTYTIHKTLNMSKALRGRWCSINLRGAGMMGATILVLDTGGQPGIDLSGNAFCQISDMQIRNRSANVGVLLSRPPDGGSAGNHTFRNLLFDGAYPVSAVYSIGSEVNRWYDCQITNQLAKYYQKGVEGMKAGDAFIFAASNIKAVKSPYVEGNTGGCNTEMTLVGCSICNEGPDTVGLRIVGYASDVRTYGCYFHSDGFSAIYLDGAASIVNNVAFRDSRIEGEDGLHCLYATGSVSNLTLDGGDWYSGAGVPVLQKAGLAHNWSVRGLSLNIWDGIDFERKKQNPKVFPVEEFGYHLMMHIEKVQFSRLECKTMNVVQWRPDEDGKVQQHYFTDAAHRKAVLVEQMSTGNTFVVQNAAEVVLKGEKKGRNTIVALATEEGPQ